MAELEFVYWALRGLGQGVVSLLEHLQLPYTHTRLTSMQEWGPRKAGLIAQGFLLANVPYIRDGDLYLCESHAVMRYLCKKAGRKDLLPSAEEDDKFAELTGAIIDFKSLTTDPFYLAKSTEELVQSLKTVLATRLASKVEAFSTMLSEGGFLFGRLTYLDFPFAENLELLFTMQEELKVDLLAHKDVFEKYVQRVNALRGIPEYRSSDRFHPRPFNYPQMSIWH